MPTNITDVDTFTSPIQAIADGDAATEANFKLSTQGLSNRTRNNKNRIDTLATTVGLLGTIARSTVQTTDGTVTTVATVTPADEKLIMVRARVVALRDTGAEGAGYELRGTFRRDGGTTVQVGSTTVDASHEDTAGWDAVFSVASPDVRVRVTGEAAKTINWACVLETLVVP